MSHERSSFPGEPSFTYMLENCPWMLAARQEQQTGVSEVSGRASNPRINEYFRSIGRNLTDNYAWCGAFIGWCLLEALGTDGIDLPRYAAGARFWLPFGFSLGAGAAEYGGIAVFRGLSADTPSGYHVSFYCGADYQAGRVVCLGGNQSDMVCYKAYPRSKLVDVRWPDVPILIDSIPDRLRR